MIYIISDLVPGECPGPELHDARLLIEGEVCHVDCARGLKTGTCIAVFFL